MAVASLPAVNITSHKNVTAARQCVNWLQSDCCVDKFFYDTCAEHYESICTDGVPDPPRSLEVELRRHNAAIFEIVARWMDPENQTGLEGYNVQLGRVYGSNLRFFTLQDSFYIPKAEFHAIQSGHNTFVFTNEPVAKGASRVPSSFQRCLIQPTRFNDLAVRVSSLPFSNSYAENPKYVEKKFRMPSCETITNDVGKPYTYNSSYLHQQSGDGPLCTRGKGDEELICHCYQKYIEIVTVQMAADGKARVFLKWHPSVPGDVDYELHFFMGQRNKTTNECVEPGDDVSAVVTEKFDRSTTSILIPFGSDTDLACVNKTLVRAVFYVTTCNTGAIYGALFPLINGAPTTTGSTEGTRSRTDRATPGTQITTVDLTPVDPGDKDNSAAKNIIASVGVGGAGLIVSLMLIGVLVLWQVKHRQRTSKRGPMSMSESSTSNSLATRVSTISIATTPAYHVTQWDSGIELSQITPPLTTTESEMPQSQFPEVVRSGKPGPRVYISYSRFTATSKKQAQQLYDALKARDVAAILDVNHGVAIANNCDSWIDEQIRNADTVVVLLDEKYPTNLDLTPETRDALLSADFDDSLKRSMAEAERLQSLDYSCRANFIIPVYMGSPATSLQDIVPPAWRSKVLHRLPRDMEHNLNSDSLIALVSQIYETSSTAV